MLAWVCLERRSLLQAFRSLCVEGTNPASEEVLGVERNVSQRAQKQGQANTPIRFSTKLRPDDCVSLKKDFRSDPDSTPRPWVCLGSSASRVMVIMHCVTKTRASHTFGSMTSSSAGGGGCVDSGVLTEKLGDGSDTRSGGKMRARSTAERAYIDSSKKQLASMGLSFLCVLVIRWVAGDVAFICIDCR